MLAARLRHLNRNMSSNVVLCSLIALGLLAGCSGGAEEDSLPGFGGMFSGGQSSGGSAAGSAPAGATSGGSPSAGSTSGGSAGTATTGGASTGGGGQAGTAGSGGASTAGSGGMAPADGATLYMQNCVACHEAQGVGGPLAPEIQHPVRDYATWVVRKGRAMTTYPKGMDAVPVDKLSDAQLNLIWDYLDLPPQPTTGQALYLDYCGNCHGADGKGGPTMRNIVNEVDKVKEMVRKGAHPGEFDMRREYMPLFSTMRISDAELDLIYKYVESL